MSIYVTLGTPGAFDFEAFAKSTSKTLALLAPLVDLQHRGLSISSEISDQVTEFVRAVRLGVDAAQLGFTATEDVLTLTAMMDSTTLRDRAQYLEWTLEQADQAYSKAREALQLFRGIRTQIFVLTDKYNAMAENIASTSSSVSRNHFEDHHPAPSSNDDLPRSTRMARNMSEDISPPTATPRADKGPSPPILSQDNTSIAILPGNEIASPITLSQDTASTSFRSMPPDTSKSTPPIPSTPIRPADTTASPRSVSSGIASVEEKITPFVSVPYLEANSIRLADKGSSPIFMPRDIPSPSIPPRSSTPNVPQSPPSSRSRPDVVENMNNPLIIPYPNIIFNSFSNSIVPHPSQEAARRSIEELRKSIHVLEEFGDKISAFVQWWDWIKIETHVERDERSTISFDDSSLRERSVVERWSLLRNQFAEYNNMIGKLEDTYPALLMPRPDPRPKRGSPLLRLKNIEYRRPDLHRAMGFIGREAQDVPHEPEVPIWSYMSSKYRPSSPPSSPMGSPGCGCCVIG